MSDFTYEIPDEKKFFGAVQHILARSENAKDIGDKLKGGRCSIVSSNQFSGERWNAYSTSVHFYVSIDSLEFFDKNAIQILLNVCDRVMPKETGYDIQSVEIAPILGDISVDSTLTSDLEEIQNSVSNQTLQLLPNDIKEKGKEMSEVYTYLYCVENSLRMFIEKVFSVKIGSDYWNKILIPASVKRSIQVRKDAEQKKSMD